MRQNCSNSFGRSRAATRIAIGAPSRSATTGPCSVRRTVERLVMRRAVGLPHLDGLGVRVERLDLAVEHVAAVLQHQFVEVGFRRVVRRLRPADVLGEALAQHREADPHGAVGRDAGGGELHLEIGVDVAPLQV